MERPPFVPGRNTTNISKQYASEDLFSNVTWHTHFTAIFQINLGQLVLIALLFSFIFLFETCASI